MTQGTATSRQQGLRQAAAIIFALVAVVPLLVFAWTLHALDVIKRTEAQVGLSLSLAVALLGFWMFRMMLVPDGGGRSGPGCRRRPGQPRPPAVAARASVRAGARDRGGGARRSEGRAAERRAGRRPSEGDRPVALRDRARVRDRALPGIGNIREFGEVTRTMGVLWQREAKAHLGRRVQISVANSREPLVGTLSEVSDDGLILELPDEPIAIAYRRITAIEGLATATA